MRSFINLLFIFIIMLIPINMVFAEDYNYQFNNEIQQTQFDRLTHELRCLVCQNETLADSNAPLAKDLRQKIALQIMAGASDEEILNYLIKRYGDFILYRPRLMSNTYLLWFSPIIFLLLGCAMWCYISRTKRVTRVQALTMREQQRLKALLDKTIEIQEK